MKLVLLPGLHGTRQLFAPLLAHFPESLETQIIDYPSGVKLDYPQLLNLVLAQLPQQDFVLLGESFSGPLVYQVAFNKPKNLKAVIFVASFLENPRPLLLNLITISLIGFLQTIPLPRWLIKTCLLGVNVSKQTLSLCQQVVNQLLPGLLIFRLTTITRLPQRHWPCHCHALVIQAEDDRLVPQRCIKAFEQVFSDLEIKTLSSGHFILQARPDKCAEIITKTLAQLAEPASATLS